MRPERLGQTRQRLLSQTAANHKEETAGLSAQNLLGAAGSLHALSADLTREEDILAVFSWVRQRLGGVDLLVNNAGIIDHQGLTDGRTERWAEALQLNVLAVAICSREALASMRERGVDGHIVNICSTSAHFSSKLPLLEMYSASKRALTAFKEGLRKELAAENSMIKVTNISPGLVRTEMILSLEERLGDVLLKENPQLTPKDIADTLVFVLGQPPHVQIDEIIIRPVGEKV
ncbi:farnesol dehydrogenase-like isoform X2 [Bacillus rossius redtenbacheri]|uniref:farnesol dehydrogenase-like isoform X2 n=1 Tax=Bacillus rossius redtenbacheri TaxID=93214 RepID=UPI002FDE1C3C